MQLLVTHMHVELLFAEHAIAAYQCTMSEIFGVTNHVLCHAFADNDREKMVIIRLSAVQGDPTVPRSRTTRYGQRSFAL